MTEKAEERRMFTVSRFFGSRGAGTKYDEKKRSENMLIDVHHENDRGDIITLREELTVTWRGKTLVVPAGFECDGASVPRFLWGSVSPQIHPCTLRGAVAHDYLYRHQSPGWTRKMADKLFYDLIREDGLPRMRAKKAYWGVRIFGGESWAGTPGGKRP